MTLIWMAAILDLSNMAPAEGAQLGSRDKSKLYDLRYKWSKIGAFATIWTIIWLSPLTNSQLSATLTQQLTSIGLMSHFNKVMADTVIRIEIAQKCLTSKYDLSFTDASVHACGGGGGEGGEGCAVVSASELHYTKSEDYLASASLELI